MVALNEQFTLKNPSLGSENRVRDFFCEAGQGVGNNRLASRIGTKEKTTYSYELGSGRPNWPNRDPLGEFVFLMLFDVESATKGYIVSGEDVPQSRVIFAVPYSFVDNDLIGSIDLLGLISLVAPGPGRPITWIDFAKPNKMGDGELPDGTTGNTCSGAGRLTIQHDNGCCRDIQCLYNCPSRDDLLQVSRGCGFKGQCPDTILEPESTNF